MSGHVFIIGFMGAGKSSVGRLVASGLGRPMVDLDTRICEREGASIPDLFASVGETAFRDAERDALREAVQGMPSVIACGGGVVVRQDNRDLIRGGGTAVYLGVTLQDILARVSPDGTRPLLATSPHDVGRLLEERLHLYEDLADITVDTSGLALEAVADAVTAAVSQAEAR